jgi:hypothetical protein
MAREAAGNAAAPLGHAADVIEGAAVAAAARAADAVAGARRKVGARPGPEWEERCLAMGRQD